MHNCTTQSPTSRTQAIVALGGVNMTDEWGLAFLHYAAAHGRLRMIKFLVEKGARLDVKVTRPLGSGFNNPSP